MLLKMKLEQFIGKTVISTSTKQSYRLYRITSPYIDVESEQPGSSGYPSHYRFVCTNGDPISNGKLVFKDPSLTEPFKKAYDAYCHSREGGWDDFEYWMKKD